MIKQALTVAGLLVAVGLSGCSVRHAEPTVHNAPVEPEVQTISDESKARIDSLELGQFQLGPAGPTTADALITRRLKPLADILFNEKLLGDREVTSSNQFYYAVTQFNTDILLANKLDSKALERSGILQRYKDVLLTDCDSDLRGTCKVLVLFGNDGSTGPVVQIIASKETDVLEYYRLLKVSLERTRLAHNQDLYAMYLERAHELSETYRKVKEGETGPSQQNLENLRVHDRITQNILTDFNPDAVNKERLDKLMLSFSPWTMSRQTSANTSGMDKILKAAVSKYLYTDATKQKIDPVFEDQVQLILDSENELYGDGIGAIHAKIEAGNSGKILANFGLLPDYKADEYMYLVDRIYYSHFTAEDAISFWQNTTQDRMRLLEAVGKFTKIQIANMIVWTNDQMNTFFKENAGNYKSVVPLLVGAVNNSLTTYAKWDNTLNRVDSLVNFVSRQFGNVDAQHLPVGHPYRDFQESITSLTHNVKMLSVYPNMMMLVYMMAKNNFNAVLQTFWGPVTLAPSTIIKIFFIDVMEPWFNFGTDKLKISQIELLYAMHFTLQTETFAAFKDNPRIPIDESQFIGEIVEKLTNDYVVELDDDYRKIRTQLESNDKQTKEALAACREERQLGPLEAQMEREDGEIVVAPRTYVRAYSYEAMGGMLSNGFPNSVSTPVTAMMNFYSPGLKVKGRLMNLRTVVESRLLYIRNLHSIIRSYLEETGNTAALANFDKTYQERLAPLTNLRNGLYKASYDAIQRIDGCDHLLYAREMRVRAKLFQMEQKHFLGVAKTLELLRDLDSIGKKAEVEAVLAKANADLAPTDESLPASYLARKGYDRFVQLDSGFYYRYHKLDAKLRMRANIIKIAPATEITLPNFDKLEEYQKPTPVNMVIHPVSEEIPNPEQQFVDEGMKMFATYLNTMSGETPTFLAEKLDIMTQLYRIGPLSRTGAPGCTGEDCLVVSAEQIIREAIAILKVSETSEWDDQILKWKSSEQKHPDTYWETMALETGTRRQLGLLDLTFQRIASDTVDGDGRQVIQSQVSSYFQTLAKKFSDTEASVGKFFFQPRPTVIKSIHDNYAAYVQDYEDKVNGFLAAYEKLRAEPDLRIERLVRSRTATFYVPTETIDGKTVPVYLPDDKTDKYEALVSDFHDATKGQFKKKEGAN